VFEKLEQSLEFKHWMHKWHGKPKGPTSEEQAKHYSAILGMNKQFFFDTNKLSISALDKLKDIDKDLFHRLWAELRESGWRYFAEREGDSHHWYTIYQGKFLSAKEQMPNISETEQNRWESEYYDNEFVKEN
jgi:hypothetical protein